jgi:hypothetical protein
MATDVKKKWARKIEDPAATAIERAQLVGIVRGSIDQCSIKILRRIARMCGARPAWTAPAPTTKS